MKKILSERNFAIILFFVALVVFVFAQQDARKVEKMFMRSGSAVFFIIPPAGQPASDNTSVISKSETDPVSIQ